MHVLNSFVICCKHLLMVEHMRPRNLICFISKVVDLLKLAFTSLNFYSLY
jgi:hypothetical protein